MTQNSIVNELITKAGLIAGSEYKLAKTMGIPQTIITDWKAGRRTCTPPDRARLADLAQEDAVQELVRATIEATAGTKRGEQLRAALGKWKRQAGAVSGSTLAGVLGLWAGGSWLAAILDLPRCIECPSRVR